MFPLGPDHRPTAESRGSDMVSVETTSRHCLYGGLKAHDGGNLSCQNGPSVIYLSFADVG